MTLEQYLDEAAHESGLRIGVWTPVMQRLADALPRDPALTSHAQTLIAQGMATEQQCHITRWRNTVLRRALRGGSDV